MRVILNNSEQQSDYIIEDCTLCFGGMAPTTVVARQASHFLIGRYDHQSSTLSLSICSIYVYLSRSKWLMINNVSMMIWIGHGMKK